MDKKALPISLMRRLLARIIRKLLVRKHLLEISYRVSFIQLKYTNSILQNCNVGKGCVIKCTDTSKLNIQNSTISKGCIIIADHGGKIEIKDSFIGPYCIIVARESISIGPHCQIAEMVTIRDQNHNFGEANTLITDQGFTSTPIVIEENVWLGAKVTVTEGSHIGKNTVVGANALVRGRLKPNSVYGGIPAKWIKSF